MYSSSFKKMSTHVILYSEAFSVLSGWYTLLRVTIRILHHMTFIHFGGAKLHHFPYVLILAKLQNTGAHTGLLHASLAHQGCSLSGMMFPLAILTFLMNFCSTSTPKSNAVSSLLPYPSNKWNDNPFLCLRWRSLTVVPRPDWNSWIHVILHPRPETTRIAGICRCAYIVSFPSESALMGTEWFLRGYKHWLFFQRFWVQFSAPTWQLTTIFGIQCTLSWSADVHAKNTSIYINQ